MRRPKFNKWVNMIKRSCAGVLLGAGMVACVSLATPKVAHASIDCTEAYLQCIDEAYNLPNPERQLAYLECGAEYAACIAKKLGF